MKSLVLSFICLCLTAVAADLGAIPEQRLLVRRQDAPQIDGKLDDWPGDPTIIVDPATVPKEELRSNNFRNPIGGPADVSAKVWIGWDETNLYLAGQVRDDHLVGVKPVTEHNIGPAGWFVDAVMLHVRSFRQPLLTNTPYEPIPFLALRYTVPAGGRGELADNSRGQLDNGDAYWKLPRGSRLACVETADGYQVEAAIPWAALGFVARPGEALDFDCLIADTDPDEALNQLGWCYPVTEKAQTFRLAVDPRALAMMSVAKDEVTVGQPQILRLLVDAVSAPVRVDAVELTMAGKIVGNYAIGADVPVGQRLDRVLKLDTLPPTPGPATLDLVATVDGKKTVLTTQAFTLLPPQAPPPLVVNPPGELRRPSPRRIAHHAGELQRRGEIRHGFVKDRSGYEHYLLTHVKDYVDGRVPNMIKANEGKWASRHAMESYALFRITGDEKYAEWTRECLRLHMDWMKSVGPKEALGTIMYMIWPRYFIWQSDPDTDLAPPNIEQDFAAIWAALAAAPPDEFFTEWGYHNRCYHRWMWCKLAQHFAEKLGKPVDPQIPEYIAWHEQNLMSIGDTTDNSANYIWVWIRYPEMVHAATGTLDEFWANPGYRAAAERYLQYVSPGGAFPNWAAGNGWGTGLAEAIGHMELFGALGEDGRFPWASHRMVEYVYNNFYNSHGQYHLLKDTIAENITFAWLITNPELAERQPSARSMVTFRPEVIPLPAEEKGTKPGLSFHKIIDRQVPDKLILKSWNDPFGLWAIVELMAEGGHAGLLPGNIMSMTSRDSVLYGGQGYYETTPDFNNVVWVEDLEGAATDPRPTTVEAPVLVDDDRVTWARLRIERYAHLPITAIRDIVFVKNGFVVLRDKLTFHGTMKVRLGPCWNTRSLGPQCGGNWFNTYYDELYFTGLGLGRGVHAWPNPPMDLTVIFAERPDCRVSVDDRYDDNPYRVSPVRLRQAWSGIVQPGDTRTFVTLLVPHRPVMDVRTFRDQVNIAVDTPDSLVVGAPLFNLDYMNNPVDSVVLQLHDGDGVVEAENWGSDARFAFVYRRPNGQLYRAVMVDGTVLRQGGDDLAATAVKPTIERVFVEDGTP